jgi:hypothetical protein
MLLSMTPKRSREGVTGCRTRAEKACTASKLGAGTLSCGFWPGQQVEARSRFVPVRLLYLSCGAPILRHQG